MTLVSDQVTLAPIFSRTSANFTSPLINKKYGKTLVELVYACIYIGQSKTLVINVADIMNQTALRATLHLFARDIVNRAFANCLGFPIPGAISQSQRE